MIDPLAWQDDALCAEIGGNLMFPELGESSKPAKRVCAQCTVSAPCLQYALDNKIREGVWGGLSRMDREQIWREMGVSAEEEESVA